MIIILPYSQTTNPVGYPGNYPSEVKEIDDKDPIPEGWLAVTQAELNNLIDQNREAVAAVIAAFDEAPQIQRRSKIVALDNHLDAIAALVSKRDAGTSTTADAVDVSWRSARALLGIRKVLAELIRSSNAE